MSLNSSLPFVLVVGVGVILFYASRRWKSSTTQLGAQLDASRQPITRGEFSAAELIDLPAPVQRYLSLVFQDSHRFVNAVTLEQKGHFNQNELHAAWKPFTAIQRISTQRPGFIWDARIQLYPAIALRVRDAYVAGEGFLRAALFGVYQVANVRDSGELAKGELMRYLAEMAWYPTAFLPGQGLRWESVDHQSSRATLTDGNLSVSLLFHFNPAGMLDSFHADSRTRTMASETTVLPWEGHFWNYELRYGMQIPLEGEVSWIHPDGKKPYWKGILTKVHYEFAQ